MILRERALDRGWDLWNRFFIRVLILWDPVFLHQFVRKIWVLVLFLRRVLIVVVWALWGWHVLILVAWRSKLFVVLVVYSLCTWSRLWDWLNAWWGWSNVVVVWWSSNVWIPRILRVSIAFNWRVRNSVRVGLSSFSCIWIICVFVLKSICHFLILIKYVLFVILNFVTCLQISMKI